MKQDVSDEILGAYVDNELACSEKHIVVDAIESNPEVKDRAQALLNLKTSIKDSYAGAQTPTIRSDDIELPSQASKRIFHQSIAASFILTCGLIVGTLINLSGNSISKIVSAKSDSTLFGIKVQPVSSQEDKILLHISSSDLDKLDFLLTKTETLLKDSRISNNPLSIQVIANSEGIDLLRTTTTPYAQRIKSLQDRYTNLEFIACKNTIKRLQKNGQSVHMLDGVKAEEPALDTIINRMDKGWTYIKI